MESLVVLGMLAVICGLIRPGIGFEERFRFASYYGDHMVLQAGPESAGIWGYGVDGATVTVHVEGKNKRTATVLDGIWSVTLYPVKPGGPFTLTAEHLSQAGLTSLNLTDVLFGDVWLCGGQSNMEMTLSQVINASEELAEASKFPDVRVFSAALEQSSTELRDLAMVALPWSVPSATVLGAGNFTEFSAVCWLFGRYLYERLKYPVGLVESCWGGTRVEAWSSHRVLQHCGISENTIRSQFEYVSEVMGPHLDSVLWNAMIHPLLNMTIKGAIWYQGEDNTNYNLDLYNCTFPAMIDDWRLSFHQGSAGQTSAVFPFGFVQISTYNQGSQSDAFPRLRWHQTADFGFAPNPRMKNTFMAVSVDLVDPSSPWGSIHPRYKQDVARRLILGARAVAYGEEGVTFQGPFPTKVELMGNIMIITYSQQIAVSHFNKDVFEVCCSEKKTACDLSSSGWAPAPVFKVYSDTVFLTTHNCPDEVSGLRYAWKDWPCDWKACPVYSADHVLPAPPFVSGPQRSGRWTILE
ncbi:sialate O-acetylesterase [Polyodon spathula]|uniref:sialate O-acetylesterase n=1 Tax=Polyodon spathula TaxID=7913 RepID=UPI001B7EB64B|nr:sialate O-acetylesterase [Polyodon spathula]